MATVHLYRTITDSPFIVLQASGTTTGGLQILGYPQSGEWFLIDVMKATALAAVSAFDDMNVALAFTTLVRKASRCRLLFSCANSLSPDHQSCLLFAVIGGSKFRSYCHAPDMMLRHMSLKPMLSMECVTWW